MCVRRAKKVSEVNKENKTGKVEAEGRSPSVDKIEASIVKLDQRVETMTVQAQDKEDNKEVALGTSKIVSIATKYKWTGFNMMGRTTSTPASRLSSPRSSTYPLRNSSPKRCGKSSSGPSSLLKKTGSSKLSVSSCIAFNWVIWEPRSFAYSNLLEMVGE